MVTSNVNFSPSQLDIAEMDWQQTPASVKMAIERLYHRIHELESNGAKEPSTHTSQLELVDETARQLHIEFDGNQYQQTVPAKDYDFAQLADIYNQARVDYIVPMPMNAKRMQEYCEAYDIDLEASVIAKDRADGEVNGICMLGVRDNRTWITRLGVIPHRRRRHSGEFLMRSEFDESLRLDKSLMQLEVIKDNGPAHRLFTKLGFVATRELLVIRRAPSKVDPSLIPEMTVEEIPDNEVFAYLEKRGSGAAWTEETVSLRNAGKINGLLVTLPDGEIGWIAFQRSLFQLAHFVLAPDVSIGMMHALIAAVHQKYPLQDTKIENVPLEHPTWPVFQEFGYIEAFSRIEMLLDLNKYR
jgi:ribosomal protein S18 acetylase RimI-like enzyme